MHSLVIVGQHGLIVSLPFKIKCFNLGNKMQIAINPFCLCDEEVSNLHWLA